MFRSVFLLGLVVCVFTEQVNFRQTSFDYDNFNHVSVGGAGVWAVLSDNTVWRRKVSLNRHDELDASWVPIEGLNATQLDVGADTVWAIDASGQAHVRTNITDDDPNGEEWRAVPSGSLRLRHITVSSNGHVWATDTSRRLYRRTGASNTDPVGSGWRYTSGSLEQVSAGPAGVWGIYSNRLYYLQGSYGDGEGSGLTYISGSFKYVSSGEDFIVVVGTNNMVSVRIATSARYPTGLAFKDIGGYLKTVEHFEDQIWGVSNEGVLWNAEYQAQQCTC